MPVLRFGNDLPVEVQRDANDKEVRVPLAGPAVTTIGLPDDQDADGNLIPLWGIDEAFQTVTHHQRGIVRMHTDAMPAWIACPDWPELEQRLAGYYGAQRGEQPGYGQDETPETPTTKKRGSRS